MGKTFEFYFFNMHLDIFIAGFIVGVVFNSYKNNHKGNIKINFKKAMSDYLKNLGLGLIEFIIFIISIVISIFLLIYNGLNRGISSSLLNTILGFLSSVIFGWLITKVSSKKDFEQKQKQLAIRSYRHSVIEENKIDYGISKINKIILKVGKCYTLKDTNNCKFVDQLYRLQDILCNIRQDAKANISDWGDTFTEEINIANEVIKNEKEIKSNYRQLMIIRDPEKSPNIDQNKEQEILSKIELLKVKNKEYRRNSDGLNIDINILTAIINIFHLREENIEELRNDDENEQIKDSNDDFHEFLSMISKIKSGHNSE